MLEADIEWPRNPTRQTLLQFSSRAEALSLSDTPELVLDRTLRSKDGQDGLILVLGLILCGFRPVTLEEPSLLLAYKRAFEARQADPGASADSITLQVAQCNIHNWLHVLVDFGRCQYDTVTIRPEVSKIIKLHDHGTTWIWSQARSISHQSISQFCIAMLTLRSTQNELTERVMAYESFCKSLRQRSFDHTKAVTPMDFEGDTVLGLLVQSLSYHLSQFDPEHIDKVLIPIVFDNEKDILLKPWAQAFWAMSDPFRRQGSVPQTPITVLTVIGLLNYGKAREAARKRCSEDTESYSSIMIECLAAQVAQKITLKKEAMQEFKSDDFIVWDSQQSNMEMTLAAAVRAGNQDFALELVKLLPKSSLFRPERRSTEVEGHSVLSLEGLVDDGYLQSASPTSNPLTRILFAAASQDMDKLIMLLLNHSYKPKARQEKAVLGPVLRLAAVLGHTRTVVVLLANSEYITDSAERAIGLEGASIAGHLDVLWEVLAQHPTIIDFSRLLKALRFATLHGNWEVISKLLRWVQRRDPIYDDFKTQEYNHNDRPLAIACELGCSKSLKAIMAAGEDPSSIDTDGVWSPLRRDINYGRNRDCIRLLLGYKVDQPFSTFDLLLLCYAMPPSL